jgi:hypothetical protein
MEPLDIEPEVADFFMCFFAIAELVLSFGMAPDDMEPEDMEPELMAPPDMAPDWAPDWPLDIEPDDMAPLLWLCA